MTRNFGNGLAAAALVGAVAFQVAGCTLSTSSTKTIKPEGAAKSVTDLVSQQTGFNPTDVNCPSGVEAKVNQQFQCHFTGPEGPYTADMKVTSVNGDDVVFDIKTHRT
jgi:hypothetical protein